MTALSQDQAFALYVENGLSIRSIASNLKIGRSTVERWCRKGNWVALRSEVRRLAIEASKEKFLQTYVSNDSIISEKLFDLMKDAHIQHLEYFKGAIPKKSLKYSVRDLTRLALAVVEAGSSEHRRAIELALSKTT